MEQFSTTGATHSEKLSQPALVEEFTILGLYGYRNISLSSRYAATVLIAKNGSGKTTLLGALDAFLKAQFGRLSHLQFKEIRCKLRGEDEFILKDTDVDFSRGLEEDSELMVASLRYSIELMPLLDFIEAFSTETSPMELYGDDIFEKIVAGCKYSRAEARRVCERLRQSIYRHNPTLDNIREKLKKILSETEIVYLPTYRRIELPLIIDNDEQRRQGKRKKSIQTRLGANQRSLFNADIQFGLSDISERLAHLNQEILYNSSIGYREASASIINELISGDFDKQPVNLNKRPDKDSLSLFFSRIKDGTDMGHFNSVAIPEFDKIYSSESISYESNKFLTFFLNKLNTAIEATKGVELQVEEFVNNCNRYLYTDDASTCRGLTEPNAGTTAFDNKRLTLDRKNLKVSVESLAANRKVTLDSLSSGEKQLISLFARLYLYPKNKIILIDEPELSLSLGWQRQILIDVMNAPSCSQMIAITHSPFVFDNELEPYAKALRVEIITDPDRVSGELEEEDGLHE